MPHTNAGRASEQRQRAQTEAESLLTTAKARLYDLERGLSEECARWALADCLAEARGMLARLDMLRKLHPGIL